MALSDQEEIFLYLLRAPASAAVGFERWLLDATQVVLGRTPADAAAYVEANKNRLWNALLRLDGELVRRGRRPALRVLDQRSKVFAIRGVADASDLKEANILRDRPEIMSWIETLTDRKFEFFGAAFARFIGATKVEVTPPGNDGGVDFYALVPAWGCSDIFHSPRRMLRLVGQSKYYSSRVNVDKALVFSKSVELIRDRSKDIDDKVPHWFRAASGPIVGAIFAPRGFASGAIDKSHSRGMMLADVVDLAEGIVRSRAYQLARSNGSAVADVLDQSLTGVGWS